MRLACGAAAFNARLGLAAVGYGAETVLFPDPQEPDLLVRLVPASDRPQSRADRRLYEAIPKRHSNRSRRRRVRRWWRRPRAMSTVYRPARAGQSTEPQDLLPSRPFHGYPRASNNDFEPEPLVAILGTAGDTQRHQVTAGFALQRVLLTLTDGGLAASMLSQPIEVTTAREQLRLALGRFGTPRMVLRIGYGQPDFPTPRRDLTDVIITMERPHRRNRSVTRLTDPAVTGLWPRATADRWPCRRICRRASNRGATATR